jgi:hypothetical protein
MAMIRTGHGPNDWAPLPGNAPARARIDRARSGISFTPLTEAIRPFAGMRGVEIRAKATPETRQRAMTVVPRCGRPLSQGPYKGEPCHRRRGHKQDGCASKAAVERDNRARRTRDFAR